MRTSSGAGLFTAACLCVTLFSGAGAVRAADAGATTPFATTLELHGISFTVESPNLAEANTLKITPEGLKISNDVIEREADGLVFNAELGDINIDGSPEVYVFVSNAKAQTLIAYSANNRKSMSEIHVPDLTADQSQGHAGHDEFALVENTVVRRFPIYTVTGADTKPTGRMRQIEYKLKPGEASWQLVVDRITEF